jgi:hypothetical protein
MAITVFSSTNFPEHNENEFMKRGYLLPDGCKNLTAASKFNVQQPMHAKSLPLMPFKMLPKTPLNVPPNGMIAIPEHVTALQLAAMLRKKTSLIMLDILEMGQSVTLGQELTFETAAAIVRKYGFLAKRAVE